MKRNDLAKKIDFIFYIIIGLGIFLYSIMFPIINTTCAILVMALFVCYRIVIKKGMAFDWRLGLLVLAVFGIAVVDYHAGEVYSFTYGTLWCLSYLTGKLIFDSKARIRNSIVVFVMAAGLFVHGLLNYYNCYVYAYKTVEFTNASWPEFWTEIETSRSLVAFDFVPIAALFIIGVLFFNIKRIVAVMIMILSIIGALLDFFVGEGRFTVCIIALTSIFISGLFITKNRVRINSNIKKMLKAITISILLLIVLIVIIVQMNVIGLKDVYEESFLARDGGIFNNIRFQSIKEAIVLVIMEPMGGWDVPSIIGGAPHNVWLLFAREYDSIIFIILFAFFCLTLKDFILLIKRVELEVNDYVLLSIYLAINTYFMLETGPWRYRNYWVFLLFIDGIIHENVKNGRRTNDIKSVSK